MAPPRSRRTRTESATRWACVAGFFVVFDLLFFSPVFLSGHYFGDGVDQLIEALPMYLGSRHLWEPATMLGYPLFANPTQLFWYPLALLRVIPNSYNVFELAAYAIAGCGTFGLVRSLTRSTRAGLAGGLTYTLSGFMISHAGHIDIVSPAAWAPYTFWALAEMRRAVRARWIVLGAVSIGFSALAGQPQIVVDVLYLAVPFVLVFTAGAPAGARRYLGAAALSLLLGLLLGAIELVPAAELALQSPRSVPSFEHLLEFSVPPFQVPIRFFFPYLLGQSVAPPYAYSAFNFGSFAEMSNYAGLMTLSLSFVALIVEWRASRAVRFWAIVAVVMPALATGNGFGLAELTFHLPVLNLFRCPGRHALEGTLALAVLAGFGIAAVENGRVRRRHLFVACALTAELMACTYGALLALEEPLAQAIAGLSASRFSLNPVANAALLVPVIVFVTGTLALAFWWHKPTARVRQAVLILAIALDLSSFAWFSYWHWGAFPSTQLAAPPYAPLLSAQLERRGGRVLTLPVSEDVRAGISPNLNLLWHVPSVRGYTQLKLARTAAFLQSASFAALPQLLNPGDRSLDLAAVRYVIVPGGWPAEIPLSSHWHDTTLPVWGPALSIEGTNARICFKRAVSVSGLGIVRSDASLFPTPVRTEISEIGLVDERGRTFRLTLHTPANHDRVEVARLARPLRVQALTLRWTPGAGSIDRSVLDKLVLFDAAAKTMRPLEAPRLLANSAAWHQRDFGGPDTIFENERAFPNAWIVRRVVPVSEPQALSSVQQGAYDFHDVAVVEGIEHAVNRIPSAADRVEMHVAPSGTASLDVACAAACFVVTSDALFPGWSAQVDGRRAPLYAADYALRGAFVPAGRHTLAFSFASASLTLGATLTGIAACVLLALPVVWRRRRLQTLFTRRAIVEADVRTMHDDNASYSGTSASE